ncbi:MAG: hypothetical protein CMM01_18540 [Rhodopirellula sp.]|nr:hypothetical protein [Rhodopirellula sp.]
MQPPRDRNIAAIRPQISDSTTAAKEMTLNGVRFHALQWGWPEKTLSIDWFKGRSMSMKS